MLGALGLRPPEEAAYEALLGEPLMTVRQLASTLGTSVSAARQALAALERQGLVSRAHGSPVRYVPSPPEPALAALIARRQDELERIRRYGAELTARFRQSDASPLELVEFTSGGEAVLKHDVLLQAGAQSEVVICDRPPYRGAGGPMANQIQMEAMARGVSYRCIYHRPSLELPGRMERIRAYIDAGEQARVVPDLPIKMLLVDRCVALVICDLHNDAYRRALLVREESLLAALLVCFESLWDGATVLGRPATTAAGRRSSIPDGEAAAVLTMLSAGMKDEAIARQLRLSRRTVVRRVEGLMDILGTSSRFQAGVEAARRNWI